MGAAVVSGSHVGCTRAQRLHQLCGGSVSAVSALDTSCVQEHGGVGIVYGLLTGRVWVVGILHELCRQRRLPSPEPLYATPQPSFAQAHASTGVLTRLCVCTTGVGLLPGRMGQPEQMQRAGPRVETCLYACGLPHGIRVWSRYRVAV